MSRRRAAGRRPVLGDPKYHSKLLTKFMNMIMLDGKKTLAERIVYGALDDIEGKVKDEKPVEVLEKALDNVKPFLEVKSRRVGGATYQVPCEVPSHRSMGLAMRWVIQFARKRSGRTMKERLSAELLDAYKGQGAAVKKRDETHKMAEANKAFAHYRW